MLAIALEAMQVKQYPLFGIPLAQGLVQGKLEHLVAQAS